jgi:hypothetical protein
VPLIDSLAHSAGTSFCSTGASCNQYLCKHEYQLFFRFTSKAYYLDYLQVIACHKSLYMKPGCYEPMITYGLSSTFQKIEIFFRN